jgi:hypothetical protein
MTNGGCVCVRACVCRGYTAGSCNGNLLFGCMKHKVIVFPVLYKFPAMYGSLIRTVSVRQDALSDLLLNLGAISTTLHCDVFKYCVLFVY